RLRRKKSLALGQEADASALLDNPAPRWCAGRPFWRTSDKGCAAECSAPAAKSQMLRKNNAAQLLRAGLPPSEIARQMGTSPAAVLQYLCLKIGEGELRRSDIAFSLGPELRSAIEDSISKTGSLNASVIARELRSRGVEADRHDIAVYIQHRHARVVLGDMYELLRAVEMRMHTFAKQAFILEYGEEHWWRSGVPETIRAECAALRGKDTEPAAEPYCYTHVMSLREILDKRWPVLSKYMPPDLV